MSESGFRIVYRKPENGSALSNMDIGEVSLGGESITDLTDVELDIRVDGVPTLRLTRLGKLTYPILDSVHVDGWVRVQIITEK